MITIEKKLLSKYFTAEKLSLVSVDTRLTFTCSKSTIETLEKVVKYVHSKQ